MPVQLRARVSTLIRKRWPNLLRAILVGDRTSLSAHYDTIGLINDFSSLSPPLQEKCKSALSRAVKSGRVDAAAVFEALAGGITVSPRPPRGASDLVIDYVAAVAAEWSSGGLRAGRALKHDDSSYTSKFHRFCDLVLTALVEPESRHHLEDLDQLSAEAWARQRQLPRQDQEYVRGGLRRQDAQWLVTAHCLRAGSPGPQGLSPLALSGVLARTEQFLWLSSRLHLTRSPPREERTW